MTATASRRAFLSAGAAAATTVGVPATLAWARDGADDELEALWGRWRAQVAEGRRLSRLYHEASDRLPWWAAPGSAYLPCKGDTNGWPAIQGVEPDENPMVRRMIRPGLGDLKDLLRHETAICGDRSARARYRERVRALAFRRYAQKLERRKVGLPAIEAASDINCDACLDTAGAIEALPVTSFAIVTARLLVDFTYESSTNDPVIDFNNGTLVMTLKALRPHLRGLLARDVDWLVENSQSSSDEWLSSGPQGVA